LYSLDILKVIFLKRNPFRLKEMTTNKNGAIKRDAIMHDAMGYVDQSYF
jgi:hypothetical protein